jgi:small-conductance mechanosensitive channel
MSNLAVEVLLRLLKAAAALVVGALVWVVVVGPLGAPASVELALLCWLAGAAFILLVESSPI